MKVSSWRSEIIMKLPVIAGFIFPNGKRIETAGIGHCKMALRYIMDNNLLKQYKDSNLAEDDFLIEKLGCAKIAMYCGKSIFIYHKIIIGILHKLKKFMQMLDMKYGIITILFILLTICIKNMIVIKDIFHTIKQLYQKY